MDDLLDIDRSLPGHDDHVEKQAKGPSAAGQNDTQPPEAPRPLPRVRTRLNLSPTEDETPPGEPRGMVEAGSKRRRPRRERRPIGPLLSGLNNEQLSLLAGISMTLLFVFLYFAIYEAEADPDPLLYYTLASSLITAVAIWFYMRAEKLVREQANFISGILGVLGLVFIWLGVDRFSATAWKMIVAVLLSGLATICFFAGQVLRRQ